MTANWLTLNFPTGWIFILILSVYFANSFACGMAPEEALILLKAFAGIINPANAFRLGDRFNIDSSAIR